MQLLRELHNIINEVIETGSTNQLRSITFNLAELVENSLPFFKQMVEEHGYKTAKSLLMARFARWFNNNYASSRSKGHDGLRDVCRFFSNNLTGPLKHQFLEIANLPVYSIAPDGASKGIANNAKFILDNLPAVLEAYGKYSKDRTFVDLADKLENAWRQINDFSKEIKPEKKIVGKGGRDNTTITDDEIASRERNVMRGQQAASAEDVLQDTLNRIPNDRLRHVIRTEVMRSANKLATLDRLLVQYGIELN